MEYKYSQCNHYLSNRFDVTVAFWAFKINNEIFHIRCVVFMMLFMSCRADRFNKKRRPIIFRTLSIILCFVRLFIVFDDELSRTLLELQKIVQIDIFFVICPWLIPQRRCMSHAQRSRLAGRCRLLFMVCPASGPGLGKLGVGRRAVVVFVSCCCCR